MAHQAVESALRQTNLANETFEYLLKREELRLAEIQLMRERERVAELRRQLPAGPTIPDYEFEESIEDIERTDAPTRKVRLSGLFTTADRPLVLYHFMYGKTQVTPCPMCTMLLDGWNGVAHHLLTNVDVVVVAAAGLPALREHARARGWHRLRLLSCGDNTFKYDLGSEDRDGNQDSMVSVFVKDSNGAIRHFYSAHPAMARDIKQRGLDLLFPVYNILDLTPQGRKNWTASLSYSPEVSSKSSPGGFSDRPDHSEANS